MAQGLIRPVSSPNRLPTSPTPTRARCSAEGRRVTHAAERAPPLLPCIPPPRHASLPLPFTFGEARRPPRSLSALPHSPLLALASVTLCAAASTMAGGPSSPPPRPHYLWALSCPTECTTTFTVVRRPSCAPFPVATAAVVPSPPEQPPVFLLLARPAGHRPPLAMSRSPRGAPGSA